MIDTFQSIRFQRALLGTPVFTEYLRYFYPELRKFDPLKEIRLKIEPLGIKTLVVGPKNEIEKLISSF